MKTQIHPTYYNDAKITCACGNSLVAGSTKKKIHTETCSACHPFFTGKQKLIDTSGVLDRFKKRAQKTAVLKTKKTTKKSKT
ncbi:MAG: 50S ribosomal protein L31 [Candidatus Doudnabacteria bacterium CG10_big_fil_rev_8_21_14_0_10_41_10]|uniref:50S ribosomal protein L31 n=1 Tax=Candidatus Doudnabacteria bacterium CG10_big_fil_rev_8_21_14_0_10_41_10 TaxID=1974551 RepID=A0A2H0VCF7_9BACT|nr:MAG: 50S ribosomal protein L31 [Candidatus Doudnabacteria bacterium CG10_big_fil_rev_8_21_14_0_10_41_10]